MFTIEPLEPPSIRPTWADIRHAVRRLATERREWAGMPLPIEDHSLVIHPAWPNRSLQGACLNSAAQAPPEAIDEELVNHWTSVLHNREVFVVRRDGRAHAYSLPLFSPMHRLTMAIDALCPIHIAWTMDAETRAIERLREQISAQAFRCYAMAGQFLETSARSGVTYLFRRLRPTIAMRTRENGVYFLAALCGHPIGYYANTFAGTHVPTDDVLAHVLMMRADEHMYWRRCEQHRAWEAEAGI